MKGLYDTVCITPPCPLARSLARMSQIDDDDSGTITFQEFKQGLQRLGTSVALPRPDPRCPAQLCFAPPVSNHDASVHVFHSTF